MTPHDGHGILSRRSRRSVDLTVEHLRSALQEKGITLFALIDHSGEAARIGMTMRATKLLIVGNPKAGTPLMLAAPTSAIDLPLKILVWEDDHGETWISMNSAQYLQERHGLPEQLLPNIAALETLVEAASTRL